MTLPLLLGGFIPVHRLYAVRLGVVPENQLHDVSLAEVVPIHQGIDDSPTLPSNASAYPICSFFFSHTLNVHHCPQSVQGMFNQVGSRLRFVQQNGKIPVTIIGFCMGLVTEAYATIGLSSNGQRPAPGESLSPLSGGSFFGCRI